MSLKNSEALFVAHWLRNRVKCTYGTLCTAFGLAIVRFHVFKCVLCFAAGRDIFPFILLDIVRLEGKCCICGDDDNE